MFDGKAYGDGIVEIVKGFVEREIGPLKAENESLKARLAEIESRPMPDKGEKGEAGADGLAPDPDTIAEAFRPVAEQMIAEAVAKAVAELPPPERGERGEKGEAGQSGRDGADGKDGAGIVDGFIQRDGHLIATLSDGSTRDFGEIVGRDGAPGNDGRDGFGFEDMDACVLDDDRTIELSFRRGEEEKCFTFKWPTAIYRDVYKEGQQYEPGDMVTWGGSLWHCNKATTAKPGTEDWTLAAKKGRDGKDKN